MSKKAILERLALQYTCKANAIVARMVFLGGYTVICGRCGGTGKYSYNQIDGDRCYGCNGAGETIKKLTEKDAESFISRVDAGELKPYFERNAAKAWIKKQSKRIFEAWGKTNVAKAYSDNWLYSQGRLFDLNKAMCDLQEAAHKIIYDYAHDKADIKNASADMATLESMINQFAALDVSEAEAAELIKIAQQRKAIKAAEYSSEIEKRNSERNGDV